MKRTLALTLLLTLLFCGAGFCEAFEGEDDRVYTMVDEAGAGKSRSAWAACTRETSTSPATTVCTA